MKTQLEKINEAIVNSEKLIEENNKFNAELAEQIALTKRIAAEISAQLEYMTNNK